MNGIKTACIWRAIMMLQLVWFWTSQMVFRFRKVTRIIFLFLPDSHSPLRKARVDFFQDKRINAPVRCPAFLRAMQTSSFPFSGLRNLVFCFTNNFLVVRILRLCCSGSVLIYHCLFNFLNSWKNTQVTGADRVMKPTSVATVTLCVSYEQQQKHGFKQALFTKGKCLPY